jgi:GNAT superfamily N-acetyltransferase
MIVVRRIAAAEPASLDGLCLLLQDAVHGGASVGFLSPVTRATAELYWKGVFAELPSNLRLWVAELDGRVVGSVQLDLCGKENGRHRAELQKLFVLRDRRGSGIASALLTAVETYARGEGRTLLVLDTETGSPAEEVYRRRGWQYGGSIPDYATTPDGRLHPTSYYFKKVVR